MIYTVTLNPALDKTVEIPGFQPNQVNRICAARTDPGGKGINVSKVVKSLGGESVAVGILAGNTGKCIEQALRKQEISCSFLYVPGETRTNLKIVDKLAHTNTDINEAGPIVPPETEEALLSRLAQKLTDGDIVVLSGSVPGGISRDVYARWTTACTRAGARVFLDADGDLLRQGVQGKPFLVKPNRAELEVWAGRPLNTKKELEEAGKALLSEGVSRVVISLGGDGAVFLRPDETIWADGLSVPVGSTVGAGDSMMAALVYGYEKNLPEEEIFRLAIATSAANVMCSGTQAAPREEIERLLPKVMLRK